MDKHTDVDNGCCKDDTLVIKPTDNHTCSQPVFDFIIQIPQVINADISIITIAFEHNPCDIVNAAHSPPYRLQESLFIKNCNIRV